MQLDWIESFLAVVRHRGFAAASAAVYRSQPRISAHIAALENELNAALFDRSQRPVALTHAGQAFLQHAVSVEAALVTAREEVSALGSVLDETVRVGTYASAGARFLPPVLATLREQHPLLTVQLVEQAVAGLDEAMNAGAADLMIRPTSPTPAVPNVHAQPLWRERMQVVVREDHPLASTAVGALPSSVLDGERLVIAGAGTQSEASRLLTGRGVQFQIGYVSDQPLTQIELVRAGLGVGFLNAVAVTGADLRGLRVLDLADPDLVRDVALYWTDSLYSSRAGVALREIIRTAPPPTGAVALSAATSGDG